MKIKNYKAINKNGLISVLDIFLEDKYSSEINGIKIVESREGGKYVQLPAVEYTSPEGERKFRPTVFVKSKARFDDDIYKAIAQYLENGDPSARNRQNNSYPSQSMASYQKAGTDQNNTSFDDIPF